MQEVGEPREAPPTSSEGLAAAGARSASLLSKAVRGAFWMVLSGSGARVLGIVGTLAVTRYLDPEEYGEVSLAMLVLQITHMLANSGLSQYIASRPKAGREVVFHATFFYTLVGIVALLLTLLFGARIGEALHAPGIARYFPGLAIAVFLERIAVIQDRIQLRELRFRSVGLQRSLGELVYSGVSVGLAAFAAGTPYGGAAALVWASLARSTLRVITLSATTPRRDWLEPHKLDWSITRELFSFGLPMAVVTIAGFGAQKFDNLVFEYHFGLAWLTFYNLAYNFADMPAALIGEQVGDVLVPSFAHMEDDERRKEALLLAIRMMILLVTPLAIGLGIVAPTLGKVAFDVRYQEGIIKVLQWLSLFSMARTVTWIGNSYLQVRNKPRTIMILETGRMLGILVFMNLFVIVGMRQGPGHAVRWACAAVVFVFTMSALSYLVAIRNLDKVPLRAQILPLVPPLVAAIPMALAVVGARRLMTHFAIFALGRPRLTSADHAREFGPRLVVEILVGAIVFVPSALLIAPGASRELITLVRNAAGRRRKGSADGDAAPGDAPSTAG